MKFLISFLLLQSVSFAACLSTSSDQVSINWVAFKTPLKIGVGGTFKKVKFNGKLRGDSIKSVVEKAKFSIDSSSVFTKNPGRDVKIAKFFFSTMENGSKINGEVVKLTSKKVVVRFTMNNKSVEVPLKYTIANNELKAMGTIDILDFSLNSELAALNKACFAKHEGKTWNDVDIELLAKFMKCK
jgi:polyisoprenoid-binding protein YceI